MSKNGRCKNNMSPRASGRDLGKPIKKNPRKTGKQITSSFPRRLLSQSFNTQIYKNNITLQNIFAFYYTDTQ